MTQTPPPQVTPQAIRHRTDIQSLRALAIAIVVAAHAHVPWLQGGYVGVDVFFVLSGYLISGLILAEVEATRHFNAWAFYARRLKRLLPALLLVLLCVAGVAWILASPQRQGENAATGQAASLWLSNFYFAARLINYFSADLGSNLFLHTWSLAVEEQFYLVWPWLLLFLFGIWRWQGAPFSRKRLAIGFGLVAMASLAVDWYWSRNYVEADFYLMPSRAWEFAMGALTFMLRQVCDTERVVWLNRWRGRSLLNATGWSFILVASVLYPDDLRYPGLWALLPCIGAALVLYDAPEKQGSRLLSRLMLRQPGLQFVGDISYSLYLWHWPVLILGGEILGASWQVRLGLVAVSVVLAALTFVAIENPLRSASMRHSLYVFVPSALGTTLGFFVMGAWQTAAVHSLQTPVQERIEIARMNGPELNVQQLDARPCDTWYKSAEVSVCTYGPKDASHSVVMFGDSVLVQWFPAVTDIYLKQLGWRLVVLTKSACSAQEVSYYYPIIRAPYAVCDLWRKRAINYIAHLHPDVVIMGSAHYGFTPQQWITGTRAVLDRLSPATRSIVVMNPTPELGFDGLDCLSAQAHWPHWLRSQKQCKTSLTPISQDSVFDLLNKAALPYANVKVIDLRDAICPAGECRAQLGQTIVYRDEKHLTASFVHSLAPALQYVLLAAGVIK